MKDKEILMKYLNFSSFALTLKKALQEPNSNEDVVRLLLGWIIEKKDISNKKGKTVDLSSATISNLLNNKENLHKAIIMELSSTNNYSDVLFHFKKNIIPTLINILKDDLIENYKNLINDDNSISPSTKSELFTNAYKDKLDVYLTNIFLYAIQKPNKLDNLDKNGTAHELTPTDSDIEALEKIIKKIPAPPYISPPTEHQEEELPYICALLAAYAEAKGLSELSKDELSKHPQYFEDLKQRRIEYYSADAIRSGIRDILPPSATNEFDLFKNETHNGINDTYKRCYTNGFEKLLAVMEKATTVTINRCIVLSRVNWIGNNEKKGVCHILVNDGVIKWTVNDE